MKGLQSFPDGLADKSANKTVKHAVLLYSSGMYCYTRSEDRHAVNTAFLLLMNKYIMNKSGLPKFPPNWNSKHRYGNWVVTIYAGT